MGDNESNSNVSPFKNKKEEFDFRNRRQQRGRGFHDIRADGRPQHRNLGMHSMRGGGNMSYGSRGGRDVQIKSSQKPRNKHWNRHDPGMYDYNDRFFRRGGPRRQMGGGYFGVNKDRYVNDRDGHWRNANSDNTYSCHMDEADIRRPHRPHLSSSVANNVDPHHGSSVPMGQRQSSNLLQGEDDESDIPPKVEDGVTMVPLYPVPVGNNDLMCNGIEEAEYDDSVIAAAPAYCVSETVDVQSQDNHAVTPHRFPLSDYATATLYETYPTNYYVPLETGRHVPGTTLMNSQSFEALEGVSREESADFDEAIQWRGDTTQSFASLETMASFKRNSLTQEKYLRFKAATDTADMDENKEIAYDANEQPQSLKQDFSTTVWSSFMHCLISYLKCQRSCLLYVKDNNCPYLGLAFEYLDKEMAEAMNLSAVLSSSDDPLLVEKAHKFFQESEQHFSNINSAENFPTPLSLAMLAVPSSVLESAVRDGAAWAAYED